MGVRGEVFSTRVILPNRTYFFNVKENRMGDLYLNIVESKNREEGGFDRQSVILFADDLQEFLKGFDESLRVLEKSARDKKRGGEGAKREGRFDRGERADSGDRPERGEKLAHGEKFGHGDRPLRDGRSDRGEKSERGGRAERADRGAKGERTFSRGPKGNSSFRGKSDRGAKDNYHRSGEKPGRGDRERGSDRDRGPKGGKRVVVRKSER
jgi:hypothetical protein